MATYLITIPDDLEPEPPAANHGTHADARLWRVTAAILEAIEPGSSSHCLGWTAIGSGNARTATAHHVGLGVNIRRFGE